jgi:hypothetical protein
MPRLLGPVSTGDLALALPRPYTKKELIKRTYFRPPSAVSQYGSGVILRGFTKPLAIIFQKIQVKVSLVISM